MMSVFSTSSQVYWNVLLRMPTHAVVFVFSILVTRELNPDDFGILTVAMMAIGYARLFTNLGLGDAIIHKQIDDNKVVSQIVYFDLLLSLIMIAICLLLSEYLAVEFSDLRISSAVSLLSILLVSSSISNISMSVLKRDGDFRSVSIIESARSVSMIVLTYVLALNGFGYFSLVIGQVVPQLFYSVVFFWRAKFSLVRVQSFSGLKGLIRFGVWGFVRNQFQYVGNHADRFIIGKNMGGTDLGYYDKSITLSRSPHEAITMRVNGVLFSLFSKIKDDKEEARKKLVTGLFLLSYLSVPIFVGGAFIAEDFVRYVLGQQWINMTLVFQIVLIAQIAVAFSGLGWSYSVGVGLYKEGTIILVAATSLFVLFLYLMAREHIVNAAVVYLVFRFALMIMLLYISIRDASINKGDLLSSIIPGIRNSIIMVLILKLLPSIVDFPIGVGNVVLLVLIGVIAYVLLTFVDRNPHVVGLRKKVFYDVFSLIRR